MIFKFQKFQICLVILFGCVISNYLTNSQTALKTTTAPRKQCNQVFRGVFQGFYYNRLVPTDCSTNCYLYKETSRNNFIEFGGFCNDESCNGGVFISKFNYTYQYDCCTTDKCNNYTFANNRLNYTCEFYKTKTAFQSLVFPHRRSILASVKQCYYCNNCNMTNIGTVINCTDKFPTTKAACHYSVVDMGNNYTVWNGDCIDMMDMFAATYEKTKTKFVSCQTELCNSQTNMARLVNATLCVDGFYI